MKRVLAILAVVALVGLGAFALASAQGERGNHPDHSGGMTGAMGGMMGGGHMAERPWITLALQSKDHLQLTPDQVRALESLRLEFQKEATRRSAEIEVAELELTELLRADPVDLARVETKLRQLEGLRTDLRIGRIRTLEKGKAILTQEQRKKLGSVSPQASGASAGQMMSGSGMEEMRRFMSSERMPQSMTAMMEMARQMGNGDTMAGMVRMMEMMSMMGQMMGGQTGGQMGGMMGPGQPKPAQ